MIKNVRATKIFATQKEAINYGRKITKNQQSELVIDEVNGRIIDKDSYGNDPIPPEDTKI